MRSRSIRLAGSAGHIRVLMQWVVLAACCSAAQAMAQEEAPADPFAGFDGWIQSVMSDWKVPGVAVAAIADGEVVLAKGYGHRDVEQELPVTKDTLFAIGSNTKSFTATLLGMLNDDGALEWDTPVREYLPEFRMHDPVATKQMTARDLVTHRSGLPRHDLVWYATGNSRRELFERLRYLEPTQPFRARFQYQNLMFMAAGYLAGQVGDLTWETLAGERILRPLGMQRSNFSVDDMQQDADFSLPYSQEDDEVVRVPFRNIDPIGPAGSINSSVVEMMPYVQFHINLGMHGENRLLSERNAMAMQSPQMVMTGPIARRVRNGNEVGELSYGLGLMVGAYRGHKLVQHGGGIDGFISAMAWLPHDRIGVMVLSNLSGAPNPVPTIVSRNVFDRLLELEPIDWNGRSKESNEEQQAAADEAREKRAAERTAGTKPSHDLSDYEGSYEHPGYGTATVRVEGTSLRCRVVGFDFPLEHFHYDVFAVPDDVPRAIERFSRQRMQFFYNDRGVINGLAIPLESAADPIRFTRDEPVGDEEDA